MDTGVGRGVLAGRLTVNRAFSTSGFTDHVPPSSGALNFQMVKLQALYLGVGRPKFTKCSYVVGFSCVQCTGNFTHRRVSQQMSVRTFSLSPKRHYLENSGNG